MILFIVLLLLLIGGHLLASISASVSFSTLENSFFIGANYSLVQQSAEIEDKTFDIEQKIISVYCGFYYFTIICTKTNETKS